MVEANWISGRSDVPIPTKTCQQVVVRLRLADQTGGCGVVQAAEKRFGEMKIAESSICTIEPIRRPCSERGERKRLYRDDCGVLKMMMVVVAMVAKMSSVVSESTIKKNDHG